MAAVTYVRGDRKQVMCAVDSAVVIVKGNMLRLVTDDVRPLSGMSDVGLKAANQAAARDVFIGVAMRNSPDGSTAPIPVSTAGVFEFDCASASFEVGDLVGPAGTGSGGNVGVSDTIVAAVGNSSLAIGRVAKRGTSVTRVQVEITSAIMLQPRDTGAGVILTQAAPTAETTTTPTLTAAELLGGLITSTQSGAVTATLDTGAAMDIALGASIEIGQAFDWTLINLGSASGAATVTAATGHTVVGNMVVAITTSATFRSKRTAADTWVTYRLNG